MRTLKLRCSVVLEVFALTNLAKLLMGNETSKQKLELTNDLEDVVTRDQLCAPQDFRILILGLKSAGKKTMMCKLCNGLFISTEYSVIEIYVL